ncbi:MAG: hypothetical protein FWE33_01880 [Defluviitaleaceae bacterium]|nr:hypothetical protein [Defluviitaleaceae bacterium]
MSSFVFGLLAVISSPLSFCDDCIFYIKLRTCRLLHNKLGKLHTRMFKTMLLRISRLFALLLLLVDGGNCNSV